MPYSFNFFNNKSGVSGSGWTLNNITWSTGTDGDKCSIFANSTRGYMISPKFDIPTNGINTSCAVEAQYYVALISAGNRTAELRVGVTNTSANVAPTYATHSVSGNNNTGKKFSTYTTPLDLTTANAYVSLHHNSPSKPGVAAWWYLNVGVVTVNYR